MCISDFFFIYLFCFWLIIQVAAWIGHKRRKNIQRAKRIFWCNHTHVSLAGRERIELAERVRCRAGAAGRALEVAVLHPFFMVRRQTMDVTLIPTLTHAEEDASHSLATTSFCGFEFLLSNLIIHGQMGFYVNRRTECAPSMEMRAKQSHRNLWGRQVPIMYTLSAMLWSNLKQCAANFEVHPPASSPGLRRSIQFGY